MFQQFSSGDCSDVSSGLMSFGMIFSYIWQPILSHMQVYQDSIQCDWCPGVGVRGWDADTAGHVGGLPVVVPAYSSPQST